MKTDNFKIKGTVHFAGYAEARDDRKKKRMVIKINAGQHEAVMNTYLSDADNYESIPVKLDEENGILLSASSQFDVKVYESGETTELTFDDIGKGSEVTLFINFDERTYKRHNYCVANLKAIDILNLVDPVDFNPFESDEVATI